MLREALLAQTMLAFADTSADLDVGELLTTLSDRCVDMLDIDGAGTMLVGPDGDLQIMTASSDAIRRIGVLELCSQDGPCIAAYRTGQPVVNADLATMNDRWPRSAVVTKATGFVSTVAIPMRMRDRTIGILNLFRTTTGSANDDVALAQALADAATIAILKHRTVLGLKTVIDQLNTALQSRIVIEQAKGMIAEREQVDMKQAFERLRNHARNHNLRLTALANDVVHRTVDVGTVAPPRRRKTGCVNDAARA